MLYYRMKWLIQAVFTAKRRASNTFNLSFSQLMVHSKRIVQLRAQTCTASITALTPPPPSSSSPLGRISWEAPAGGCSAPTVMWDWTPARAVWACHSDSVTQKQWDLKTAEAGVVVHSGSQGCWVWAGWFVFNSWDRSGESCSACLCKIIRLHWLSLLIIGFINCCFPPSSPVLPQWLWFVLMCSICAVQPVWKSLLEYSDVQVLIRLTHSGSSRAWRTNSTLQIEFFISLSLVKSFHQEDPWCRRRMFHFGGNMTSKIFPSGNQFMASSPLLPEKLSEKSSFFSHWALRFHNNVESEVFWCDILVMDSDIFCFRCLKLSGFICSPVFKPQVQIEFQNQSWVLMTCGSCPHY